MIWVIMVYVINTTNIERIVPVQWTSLESCELFAKNSPSIDHKMYTPVCEKEDG
jgi:hypothetical protein